MIGATGCEMTSIADSPAVVAPGVAGAGRRARLVHIGTVTADSFAVGGRLVQPRHCDTMPLNDKRDIIKLPGVMPTHRIGT